MSFNFKREPVLVVEAIKTIIKLVVIGGTLFGVPTLSGEQASAINQAAAILVPVVLAIDVSGAAAARSKVTPFEKQLPDSTV